ncbi:MAG TPA: hypothetical protein VMW31_06740 [Devosiaceae bacterium]|nr:hypothetical protein [Devosiaceae bacterium]
MRIEVKHLPDLDTVAMRCTENCDTDSRPLVPEVQFRHCPAAFDPATASVAAAVVFADYCGEVVEFADAPVGLDHRAAVAAILPHATAIYPIDASLKDIRQGRDSIVVCEAAELPGRFGTGAALRGRSRLITWNGDFIDAESRDPSRHVTGQVATNARLVAGSVAVSLALGLLIGGRNAYGIRIGEPEEPQRRRAASLREALASIGVSVELH